MKLPVSVIVLTHNNEAIIENCLTSLLWSDDLCIIDDYSMDDTLKIASKFPARIFQRKLNDDFSQQRNYALSIAKNIWVLFVDADEVVSGELVKEIKSGIVNPRYFGYKVSRIDIQDQRRMRYGEFLNFQVIRLAKRSAGKWVGAIHETWDIRGIVGTFRSPLLHYHSGGIQNFLTKVNHYSSIRARELHAEKKKSSFKSVLFFPIGKMFFNYFLKFGFLDGIPGLINAIAMSFYTFLVRAKLWLLWNESTKKV